MADAEYSFIAWIVISNLTKVFLLNATAIWSSGILSISLS